LARLALQVLLAQLRREHDRGPRGVLVAHQTLRLLPTHLAHAGVFTEELDEGARHPPAVLLHHPHEQPPALPPVDEALRAHRDHDDRHQQRKGERRAIPQEDPQILAEDGKHRAHEPSPAATFARRRSSSPWKESFATAASNCARKLRARLTPSTTMSVAFQLSPARRSV